MEKTIKNLAKAYIGESQARNRYTTYAKIAKKEGYEVVAANFELTANQEAEHAKWLMRMMNDLKKDAADILVEAPVSTAVGSTVQNLKTAIQGESYENDTMYPEFAKIAKEEGLDEIADRLLSISIAEENHEDRFRGFLEELEGDTIFSSEEESLWQCRKCGYMHSDKIAPGECPSCGHPQAYFEIK